MTTTTTPEGAGEFPPLKPCPFCGGAATMIDRPDGPLLVGAFAGCDRCDMHTPILPFAVEAAAAWNRRAQAAEGGKEKAVAWLVEPNALSHPKMKRELTFDHPHERPDWTVMPLVRNALATPEAAEGEQSAAQAAGQEAANHERELSFQAFQSIRPPMTRIAGVSPGVLERAARAATPAPAHPLPVAGEEVQGEALKWCAAALQALMESRGERGSISMFVSGERKTLEEVLDMADAALAHAAPAGETKGGA